MQLNWRWYNQVAWEKHKNPYSEYPNHCHRYGHTLEEMANSFFPPSNKYQSLMGNQLVKS